MGDTQLKLLHKTLDDIRHQNGVEFWYARELYPILGYVRWENFVTPINKAKESCRKSGLNVEDHFRDVTKEIEAGKGAGMEISDIKLNRYACYLIALNGDPRKEEIAFAQAYFVTQTRKFEVLRLKMEEMARLDSREKLKITEKNFSDMVFSRGVDGRGIGKIRSAGDRALFGRPTKAMKDKISINPKKPLADHLPDVTLKAKDLATALTMESVRQENLHGEVPIQNKHIDSNTNIRGALTKTGIYPENLPASEDIKKVETRHRKEMKKLQKEQQKELEAATKKIEAEEIE